MTKLFPALLAICLCPFFILACKKKNDSKPAVDPCDHIVEVMYYSPYVAPTWQTTATVEYDTQGRVKHIKGEGYNTSAYAYYNDRIELTATDINGTDIGLTYYLDAKGRIKGTSVFNYRFTYDNEGHLISYWAPFGNNGRITDSAFYTLKYENGDLIEASTTRQNMYNQKVTFAFYDEPNQDLLGYNSPLYIAGVIGDRNSFYLIGAGFFGKQSVHLYKSVDFHSQYSQGGTVSYEKDTKGRITTFVGAYKYKYQCE